MLLGTWYHHATIYVLYIHTYTHTHVHIIILLVHNVYNDVMFCDIIFVWKINSLGKYYKKHDEAQLSMYRRCEINKELRRNT